MNKRLAVLCFLMGIAMMLMAFPEGFVAAATVLLCSLMVIFIIRRQFKEDANLLIQLFLIALIARLSFGLLIHFFDLRAFFGGDSRFYDRLGQRLVEIWFGYNIETNDALSQKFNTSDSGWGMYYLVAAIYSITGRNILAAQSFCAVIGAATVPMVYTCAHKIFNNRRVGKISALLVALYPAFIIWSGQLLKDGLIIFLLVLAMTLVLRLQEKFRLFDVILLGFSLFGIITLRFYIFYMAAVAIVGAFVIGTSNSPQAMMRRMSALVLMGVGLTYFGVTRNSGSDIEEYTNLERIQSSRKDLASSAESGYGQDLDVSTTEGAFAALPVGLTYLLLAPFPWQMTNWRQAITLPEVLLWWSSIPFLLSGLWYTIRYRLRSSIPILVFSLMLTLAYSIFLGNIGTAYRQRTQIQVFLFMFIAVGWTLWQERSENKNLLQKARRR
ncbi:MAG: glycosyltransferase family 39 protein [Acidobacteria bacterium]|nr:glycosyltransferase family 39 protein [Acidobacteriota bacterium]